MLYMFILYKDRTLAVPPDVMEQHGAVEATAKKRKGYVSSAGLDETETATTVRVREGKPSVTEGPFADTKEVLSGFYIIDCKDRDEALEYARQIPDAQFGAVEVRPVRYGVEELLRIKSVHGNGERSG